MLNPSSKALALMACAAPLQAAESAMNWYWHAFASQAAIYTSDNNFFGSTDDSVSTEFRELGLVLGAQPTKDLHLAVQVMSREAGEVDETDIGLDYAFASYNLYSGIDVAIGIKAGRLRIPRGFYNETRDVAHTRPGILMPQSIYPDALRPFTFSRDGGQLFGRYQYGKSTLNWDLAYTMVDLGSDDDEELAGGHKMPGEFEADFTPVARLIGDWDLGRVRLGITYADLSFRYTAAPADYFRSATILVNNWVFSAEYNAADWSLTSEYATFETDTGDLVPYLSYKSAGRSYYIQGLYRFNPSWEGFIRWDVQSLEHNVPAVPVPHSRDFTAGASWRPDAHWQLRAEWHLVDGTSMLSPKENKPEDLNTHWHMVLFQIAYQL